jgi:hypothetical protein
MVMIQEVYIKDILGDAAPFGRQPPTVIVEQLPAPSAPDDLRQGAPSA